MSMNSHQNLFSLAYAAYVPFLTALGTYISHPYQNPYLQIFMSITQKKIKTDIRKFFLFNAFRTYMTRTYYTSNEMN